MLNILLILVGLWLMRRWRRLGLSLIVLGCLSLYLFSTKWFSTQLLRSVEVYPVLSYDQHASVEQQIRARPTAIVMLGSSHTGFVPEYGTSQLDVSAILRVNYAVWLAKKLNLPVLATGGSSSGNKIAHAIAVAEYTAEHLNFELRWQESRARTTYENASLSKTMLAEDGIDQIILVSQSFHMRRAVALFEAQGFEVIPAAVDYSQPWTAGNIHAWIPTLSAYEDSYRALHEHLGWWWYSIKGFK